MLPPLVSSRSATKLEDYIVISKLCPLERNVVSGGVEMVYVKSVRTWRFLIHLTVLLLNKVIKSTINLAAIISASFALLAVKYADKQYTDKTTDHLRYRWNN